jgi:hypothetical protein
VKQSKIKNMEAKNEAKRKIRKRKEKFGKQKEVKKLVRNFR